MAKGRALVALAGAVVLAGAFACGGEERSSWSGPSPGREAAPSRAELTANQPPAIESLRLDPPVPVAGSEVRAVVRAADPDADRVTLAYHWVLDGRTLPGGEPRRVVEGSKGQQLSVTVTATDGKTEVSEQASARLANRPPELLALRLDPPGEVPRGGRVVVAAEAKDPDGDGVEFTYRWRVNGRVVEESGPALSAAQLERGDEIRVRVSVRDAEGEEGSPLESGPVRVANAPPEIVSQPPATFESGVFRYTLEARDPERDGPLRFRLLQGPEGMDLDPVLGEVSWKPAAGQAGVHRVDVAVSDSAGASSAQRFEVTVREVVSEAPPASPTSD